MIGRWFGRRRSPGWSVLDVGQDCLYGVSVLPPLVPGGKPRVLKAASLPAGGFDAESIAELAAGIAMDGCDWALTLGRKDYQILVVAEPPVPPAEMEESIRWSLGTLLPYPVEEANLAWMRIPTAEFMPNRPPQIYIMAARRESVEAHRQLCEAAHVSLAVVDVRETAYRNIAALAETPGQGLALFLVTRQMVKLIITFNGELYLDRFIEENLFDAEVRGEESNARAFERIGLQVQRSLDFIKRTLPFIEVGRVMVAPMPEANGLGEFLAGALSVPVMPLDLSTLFDFSATPELAEQENQALYLAALGCALRSMERAA